MKTATHKRINRDRKTRIAYAYSAIERAQFESGTGEKQDHADKAMDIWCGAKMSKNEMMKWAADEIDYRNSTAN